MYTQEDLETLIHLIEVSELDKTIKDILIRDLRSEGLTDFLAEQIKVYCAEAIDKNDERVIRAKNLLLQILSQENHP